MSNLLTNYDFKNVNIDITGTYSYLHGCKSAIHLWNDSPLGSHNPVHSLRELQSLYTDMCL